VLPQVYPLIRLPVFAVLAFSLSVVDVALILGPTTPPTLSVLILRWIDDPDLSFRFLASAGAVLLLLLTLGSLIFWRFSEWLIFQKCRNWLSNGKRGNVNEVHNLAALSGSLLLQPCSIERFTFTRNGLFEFAWFSFLVFVISLAVSPCFAPALDVAKLGASLEQSAGNRVHDSGSRSDYRNNRAVFSGGLFRK